MPNKEEDRKTGPDSSQRPLKGFQSETSEEKDDSGFTLSSTYHHNEQGH